MQIEIFNILRYTLLILFIIVGVFFYKYNGKEYWKPLTPLIIFYSIMEGLRWGRGTDYLYNFNIAKLKAFSNDIFYDSIAAIIHNLGFPYYIFFVFVSFTLIFSLFFFVKDYYYAFLPCSVLLYAFTMQQSENLMRQYFAISLMLISITCLLRQRYLLSILFSILAYLSHSTVLFLILLIIVFKFFETLIKRQLVVFNYLHYFFIILYITAIVFDKELGTLISNNLGLLQISLSSESKYLNEDYFSKAISNSDGGGILSDSFLDYARGLVRNFFVIYSGYRYLILTPNRSFSYMSIVPTPTLLIPYLLSCSGILYMEALPQFDMEVLARLGLYLQIFKYFIEGITLYNIFILKTKKSIVFLWSIILVIMELVWIFKPIVQGRLGLLFIWDL